MKYLQLNDIGCYKKAFALNEEDYQHILRELQTLPKEIHQLIKFTKEKLKE